MVANAPDTPVQAEVIFVIEVTSANGAYISELKTNYIVPTLEYFHGGALEEGGGSGSVYAIVTYKAADCHPGFPVDTFGPFTCPQEVLQAVDSLEFVGGHAESRACVTEALTTALSCFEELGRTDIPLHALLLCCSAPYSAYAGGLVPPGAPATVEQAARLLAERGVHLSIAAAKRVTALNALYELAGGELIAAQQRNYAKDPRHLVLLRGYSLKERPPSPAPPPVPDIQGDVYPQTRTGTAVVRPPAPLFPRAGGVRPPNWPAPTRQPIYANNSALLTQLAQPSYPPPPPTQPIGLGSIRHSTDWPAPACQPIYANNSALLTQLAQPSYPPPPPTQGMGNRIGGILSPVASPSPAAPAQPPQRSFIWSGVLEWMEKGKAPGDQQKTTRHLPCQVSAGSKEVEPELKVDTWPNKLLMQLMPKQLISNIGGQYLKDSKSVLFHLQPSEALDALTKVMVNGFAGCVHFSLMSSPPQCDIKVLILLYTPDKKAYLGFIPNNQATFVDRLRKVIQQQKITQIINKQLPAGASGSGGMPSNMPSATMSNAMPGGGMPSGSMAGSSGMAAMQQMPPAQHPHAQHPQGMMGIQGMGGQVPQVGGKGPRPVTQLDGLEAARQQNLEKIQHLQQSLEAAHQQQFKSQMDIMTHLHAAQQQEQHYKQLEEQRKQQLQQQLQQQLRGAAPHAPRLMRPMLPSNPGLRHLLQQQPQQYRPGGSAARPATQPQQFDDVPNYNDFL